MNRFASLLDRLAYEPRRNAKLRLMADYFRHTPDPERGWALAAMTGVLSFRYAKPGLIRGLAEERMDATLFYLSWDYVGDLSETVALMWPAPSPHRGEGRGEGGVLDPERAAPPHPGLLPAGERGLPAPNTPPPHVPALSGAGTGSPPRRNPTCRRSSPHGSTCSTRRRAGRSSSSSPASCASASRRGSRR